MPTRMYKNLSGEPFIHPYTQQTIWPEQYYEGPLGKPWEEGESHKLADATEDLPAEAKAVKLALDIAPTIKEDPPQVSKDAPQTTVAEQTLNRRSRK